MNERYLADCGRRFVNFSVGPRGQKKEFRRLWPTTKGVARELSGEFAESHKLLPDFTASHKLLTFLIIGE